MKIGGSGAPAIPWTVCRCTTQHWHDVRVLLDRRVRGVEHMFRRHGCNSHFQVFSQLCWMKNRQIREKTRGTYCVNWAKSDFVCDSVWTNSLTSNTRTLTFFSQIFVCMYVEDIRALGTWIFQNFTYNMANNGKLATLGLWQHGLWGPKKIRKMLGDIVGAHRILDWLIAYLTENHPYIYNASSAFFHQQKAILFCRMKKRKTTIEMRRNEVRYGIAMETTIADEAETSQSLCTLVGIRGEQNEGFAFEWLVFTRNILVHTWYGYRWVDME